MNPAASFANAAQCEFLFTSAHLPSVDIPTVRIVGTVEDANGETFYAIRKIARNLSWGSVYTVRHFDAQGDPTWGFHFLGEHLAEVMGYRWSDSGDLLVPTPSTLNRRISVFNAYLRENGISPIPVTFYLQAKATIESFLRGWANARVPVAQALDEHTLHDIGYHYPSILLAPELASALQAQAGLGWYWLRLTRGASHSDRIPRVVFQTVRNVDLASSSANRPVGLEKSADAASGARMFYGIVSSPLQGFLAQQSSPLQIFEERHRVDRILHPYVEAHFKNHIRKNHPEWDRTLTDFGIPNEHAVLTAQAARSTTLRLAAKEFLKERGQP